MTITRVGGGTLRDNSWTSGTNNTQSPSLGVTTLANDIALVYVADEDSGNAVTISVSGYTQLLANSGDNRDVEIWAKVCGAGESDPTVTYTGTVTGTVSAKSYAEVIRGASTDLGTIVHASDANDANASASTLAYPGITVTENGCYTGVLGFHRSSYNTWAATAPAAEWVERVNLGSNSQSTILYTGIQTTAANISASNFNSGAAATSAASFPIVFALLPAAVISIAPKSSFYRMLRAA